MMRSCLSVSKKLCLVCALACFASASLARASEYYGQVTFGGLPVPGATLTARQAGKSFTAVSDHGCLYTFADLPDGPGKLRIEMEGFSAVTSDITIAPHTAAGGWQLTLLPLDQMLARAHLPSPPASPTPTLSDAAPGFTQKARR